MLPFVLAKGGAELGSQHLLALLRSPVANRPGRSEPFSPHIVTSFSLFGTCPRTPAIVMSCTKRVTNPTGTELRS